MTRVSCKSFLTFEIMTSLPLIQMLFKIESIPNKMKLAIIKRMQENQIEVDRRKKEEDRLDKIKYEDIQRSEVNKSILRLEVSKQESLRFFDGL